MKSARLATLASSLLVTLALASSCAAPGQPMAPPALPTAPPAPPAAPPTAEPVAAPRVASAPRPPPPVVRAPLPGEPASAALGDARLIPSSCEDFQGAARKLAEVRIQQMHAEVDESYRNWKDQQPGCWAAARQLARDRSLMWGDAIGESFGAGGLGLSGVGQGGGGGPVVRMGAASSSPRAARSASGTNNQVVGVDEADIVKTDGRYVYLAMNGALWIVEALKPKVVSVTKLPGSVKELFVEGDRAVVYSASGEGHKPCTYGYDCAFAGDGTSTRIAVFDVADHAAPRLTRQIELSGSLMAARRIGNTVHTVVADGDAPGPEYQTWPEGLDSCGNPEAVVRAKFARLKAENERKILASGWFPTLRDKGVERTLCGSLLRPRTADGHAFTSVVSFDLRDDAPPVTATVESRPGAVFASSDALYLSVTEESPRRAFYAGEKEVSHLHEFRIGERPQDTRYLGSGVVPGHVLNQFAMDEWSGYLRVATSRGRVPDPGVSSVVSILAEGEGGNLVRVGAIDKIAPGEDIRAVRFDGDRGYVVTFKKTDPLFVMDLYEPAHPSILGELKIPGFSTYLHRIDPDHLLSIGFDANDHGNFAYFDGVILQLFDVKKATEPQLLFKEKIGTRGSSSEAATNHLAFNYFGEKGLLAFPMTICEGGGDGENGHDLTFSGLLVYDVSLTRGFTRLGGIDHGTKGADCNTWWSNANSAVKRSVFLDDLVYSIASDRVKVQRLGHFGEDLGDIALKP